MRRVMAADLFCGAGGTSTGLAQACTEMGIGLELLAINHWSVAIETHSANHPGARHLCESLDNVDPRKVVPGGRLNLLVASPECTHHSNARGGKPMSDQSRASAWHILRWAEALYIDSILVENVREFENWGPIGASGRPLKSHRGETFRAFLDSLRSLGYNVDWKILNAADYGDPTTRERLFVMARRGRKPITWPRPSHSFEGQPELFGEMQPWRAAREIIDWNVPGASIFRRKRPLAPATLARIAAGLQKFGGAAAEPFLVMLYGTGEARSVDRPLPTVTANGNHIGLCEPFVLQQQSGGVARSVEQPLPTVATKGAIALVEPYLIPFNGNRDRDMQRAQSLDEPLPTVTAGGNRFGLVEPFVVSLEHSNGGAPDPFVCPVQHHGKGDHRTYPVDRPMPTITTIDAWGLVEPFLVKYNGTGRAYPVTEPLDTVTAKDRFGLVQTDAGQYAIDIRFRMLQPHELARAMSFPDDYQFSGNRELKVRQIGNAVPVRTAAALCRELIA